MTIFGGGGSGNPFGGGRRRIGGGGMRLIIGAIIILVGIISYFSKTSVNPATGEKQRIGLSAEQETVLGLQAAPQMAQQMGGEIDPQHPASQIVERLGQQLVAGSVASKSPYKYDFHLLADPNTINAFALPGGQVFITRGLFEKLEDEAMLAGVLGHEIAHVVHRHSAEQMAKGQLGQLIVTGVGVAASESQNAGQMAAMAAQLVNNTIQLRYSREHETESDSLGLRIMTETGFDPRAMIDVMKVLQQASGGRKQPEFLATHPDPGNRIEAIERWLKENPDQARNMTRGRSLK
jgi:predicted Zn-dependent protease